MRIVVAGRYPLGNGVLCSGVERVASVLVEAISSEKDLETFVVTCSDRIKREEVFQRGNIKIFALPPLGRFGNIRLYKQERVRISEKIKGLSPDIIHTHDLGFYTLAGFSTGYPQVVSVHGVRHIDIDFENGFLNRIRKFSISYLEEQCLKYTRWAIINTPYLEKKIQERSRARLFFLENPVEDEFFRIENNCTGRDLLFVGRVSPIKGIFTLIQAVLKLKRDFPDVRLRVAGTIEDNSYFSQLKAFIQKNGLNENVIFLGCLGKAELLEEYSKASIFVLPSFQEASPMAICEAMAAGVCIVASDVGGIPSLIRNNREGVLVPPGNVEFLYTTILDLLKDDRYRIRLAESARIQAQSRFLKKKVGQTLFQIYRTILGESRTFLHIRHALIKSNKLQNETAYLQPLYSQRTANAEKCGMKNKIGFLITRLDIGGAERIFFNLVKGLDRERFEIVVICLYDIGPLGKELVNQGIKIYSHLMLNRIDLRGCYRLFNVFQKERLDILYILGQRLSQIAGVFIGRLSDVKRIIVGYHSQNSEQARVFKELILRLCTPFIDRTVCLSNTHKDFVARHKKIPLRKIEVIPNGISINEVNDKGECMSKLKELGLDKGIKIVGIVANLRMEKGHRFFLEAAKEVLKKFPDTKFLIIGDGPLKDNLKLKVKSLRVEDKVLFLGMRRDVDELLSLFDVAVLSSITECAPLAILEYMANSRPIVATKVGNIPELIIDGVTGFLVPSQDSMILADRISTLLQDPKLSLRFGSSARERVIKDFSIEKMIKRYESLFLEILRS